MGIVVTPREVAAKLAQIKKQNFKSIAEYQKFLKTSRLTQSDVKENIKLQLLVTAIQTRIVKGIKGKRARHRANTRFVAEYLKRWRARTVCAPAYVFGRCSNAHGGHRQTTLS